MRHFLISLKSYRNLVTVPEAVVAVNVKERWLIQEAYSTTHTYIPSDNYAQYNASLSLSYSACRRNPPSSTHALLALDHFSTLVVLAARRAPGAHTNRA